MSIEQTIGKSDNQKLIAPSDGLRRGYNNAVEAFSIVRLAMITAYQGSAIFEGLAAQAEQVRMWLSSSLSTLHALHEEGERHLENIRELAKQLEAERTALNIANQSIHRWQDEYGTLATQMASMAARLAIEKSPGISGERFAALQESSQTFRRVSSSSARRPDA